MLETVDNSLCLWQCSVQYIPIVGVAHSFSFPRDAAKRIGTPHIFRTKVHSTTYIYTYYKH